MVATYLGLGNDDLQHSHLDKLADVTVSPPPSPSEKKIPKRKRPGERIAREIRETAKRSKSASDDEDALLYDESQPEKPASRLNVTRRRALSSASRSRNSANGHEISDTEAVNHIDNDASLNVIVPQQSLSRLSSWTYDASADCGSEARPSQSRGRGVVSLVKPKTSMDMFTSTSKRFDSIESSSSTRSDQPYVPQTPVPAIVPMKRRAPSTGQALEVIPEEPPLKKPRRARSGRKNDETSERHLCSEGTRDYANEFVQPSFQASQSLVSTAKEVFPPVHRRHVIKDSSPVYRREDSFDDLDDLDDDDLLELATLQTSSSPPQSGLGNPITTDLLAIAQNPLKLQPRDSGLENETLPTPQASDETTYLSDDDEDGWSQLPDDALQTLDLNPSDTAQSSGTDSEHKQKRNRGTFQSPIIIPSSSPPATTEIPSFARPEFPASIQDRSPLLNITSALILKTCFRIGEAINIGTHYARQTPTFTSDGILIEFFAKVVSSTRPACHSGSRQDFVFADLWAKKGPNLHGEWIGWKGSKIFEADAKALLTHDDLDDDNERTMCRVVGRMKRENKEWRFAVLSAWRCDWDDVEYARGIVCRG